MHDGEPNSPSPVGALIREAAQDTAKAVHDRELTAKNPSEVLPSAEDGQKDIKDLEPPASNDKLAAEQAAALESRRARMAAEDAKKAQEVAERIRVMGAQVKERRDKKLAANRARSKAMIEYHAKKRARLNSS